MEMKMINPLFKRINLINLKMQKLKIMEKFYLEENIKIGNFQKKELEEDFNICSLKVNKQI